MPAALACICQCCTQLNFEDELIQGGGADDGPRLTPELIVLCEFIQRAATPPLKKEAENDL
jgi:hypothetical protein